MSDPQEPALALGSFFLDENYGLDMSGKFDYRFQKLSNALYRLTCYDDGKVWARWEAPSLNQLMENVARFPEGMDINW